MAGLNEALLAKAAGAEVAAHGRVRADTTVVPANVAYPTDSGLLARAVGKMARDGAPGAGGGRRIADVGCGTGGRAAGRRVREIASKLRSPRASCAVRKTGRGDHPDHRRAGGSGADARRPEAAAVLRNGRRALPRGAQAGRCGAGCARALD